MRRSKGPLLDLRNARREGDERRWVILDRGADGRRREISTGAFERDRATAEKAFAAYLAEKHVPQFGGGHPAQVLISDALAYYGEHKAAKAVRRDMLARALVVLGEFFVGKTVNEITPTLCNEYVEWRIRQGDTRGANRKKEPDPRLLKPATARNDLATLQAALRVCWENRKLTHLVLVSKPKASEPLPLFLTTSEAARLLAGTLGWEQHGRRHPNRINRHLARLVLI